MIQTMYAVERDGLEESSKSGYMSICFAAAYPYLAKFE